MGSEMCIRDRNNSKSCIKRDSSGNSSQYYTVTTSPIPQDSDTAAGKVARTVLSMAPNENSHRAKNSDTAAEQVISRQI